MEKNGKCKQLVNLCKRYTGIPYTIANKKLFYNIEKVAIY